MKYFLDTEFLEGIQERPLILKSRLGHWMIGKPKPTIDLISIGIVAEDGREYYAISKDFNLKEAWNRFDVKLHSGDRRNKGDGTYKVYWLRENVLYPIFWHLYQKSYPAKSEEEYGNLGNFTGWKERKGTGMKEFKKLLQEYGKTNKEIAEEVKEFCSSGNLVSYHNDSNKPFDVEHTDSKFSYSKYTAKGEPEFYAYYADYDWVIFCWLFGKMIDLPKGFPMYCKDLKQSMDYIINNFSAQEFRDKFKTDPNVSLEMKLKIIKSEYNYPEQENEHSAIDDARWNKKLYEFLKQL